MFNKILINISALNFELGGVIDDAFAIFSHKLTQLL